jgi:surface protein
VKRITTFIAAFTATAIAFTGLALAPASAVETYSSYATYASAPKEILGKTSRGIKKLTSAEAAQVPASQITVRSAEFLRSSTDGSLYKVVYETVTPISELTWKYEGYPTPRTVIRPPVMEYYSYASYPSEMIVRPPLGVYRQAWPGEYSSVPDSKIVRRIGTYFIRALGDTQIFKKSGGVTTAISDAHWRGEGSPTLMVPAGEVVGSNLFAANSPYRDPEYPSVAAAKAMRAQGLYSDAAQLDKISAHAGSLWIGEWNSGGPTTQVVTDYAQRAIDTGQTGVLVVYAIPGRACTGYSAGGQTQAGYKPWIDEIAAGIGGRRLAIILEPDALLQLGRCPELEGDRLGYLHYAAKTLATAGGTVYIDAASSNFGEPVAVMADRLTKAGIQYARGFSVNVANHKWVGETRPYADELSRLLGGKKYVIDTSRNGNGSNGGDWCNSRGRALGATPRAVSYKNQDAFLWIKTIGASDGTCGGGPRAGLWWNEIALELAQNSAISGTSVSATAMISEWDIGRDGCAAITVPVHDAVSAVIDWGDGTKETVNGNYPSHSYAELQGQYTVTVDGTFASWGGSGNWTPECITHVTRWGATGTTSAAYGFAGATNLVDIAEFAPTITDMSYMLQGNTTFVENVDTWDMSAVTNTSHMFDGATAFNRPLSMWDMSSVTDASGMFRGATAFNQPVDAWNTVQVTDFSSMFEGASAFHQPVGSWNTRSARTFAHMFDGATTFNQPVKAWDTSNVTDMSAMFRGAANFTQTLNTWNVASVTNMSSMLEGAATFDQPLGNWDVSKVTDMTSMFDGTVSQNQGLSSWDTSGVRSMKRMFAGAERFDRSIGNWDVSNVTDMTSMFEGATIFAGPLTSWNVDIVSASTNFGSRSKLTSESSPQFQ